MAPQFRMTGYHHTQMFPALSHCIILPLSLQAPSFYQLTPSLFLTFHLSPSHSCCFSRTVQFLFFIVQGPILLSVPYINSVYKFPELGGNPSFLSPRHITTNVTCSDPWMVKMVIFKQPSSRYHSNFDGYVSQGRHKYPALIQIMHRGLTWEWCHHGCWLTQPTASSSNQTNCYWPWWSSSWHVSTQCSTLWRPHHSSCRSEIHHVCAWQTHAHVTFCGWLHRPWPPRIQYIAQWLSCWRMQKCESFQLFSMWLGSWQQLISLWELRLCWPLVAVERSIHWFLSLGRLG